MLTLNSIPAASESSSSLGTSSTPSPRFVNKITRSSDMAASWVFSAYCISNHNRSVCRIVKTHIHYSWQCCKNKIAVTIDHCQPHRKTNFHADKMNSYLYYLLSNELILSYILFNHIPILHYHLMQIQPPVKF